MTNREKYILRRNEYDMLMDIQREISYGQKCVVVAITRKTWACTNYQKQDKKVCSQCIQRWLNEEVE